jgi:DNA-binding PadR family transcriptional regulator
VEELRSFSYVILTLVGEGGAGPHDIVRMMRQGRVYWTAADSHYYSEPKRLEQLGYLTSEKQPGRTHDRTHYMLTDKGRDALRTWGGEGMRFPRIQHEAVVKVLAGDIVGREAILAGLAGLRSDLDDLSARLDVGEGVAAALPHRADYLRLVHRLGRELIRVHAEWANEVERELGC